jgi:hypothetical protein
MLNFHPWRTVTSEVTVHTPEQRPLAHTPGKTSPIQCFCLLVRVLQHGCLRPVCVHSWFSRFVWGCFGGLLSFASVLVGRILYERLRVKCHIHENCQKYRVTAKAQQGRLGRRGPIAYLGVWLARASTLTRDNHKYRCRPTFQEMEDMKQGRGLLRKFARGLPKRPR